MRNFFGRKPEGENKTKRITKRNQNKKEDFRSVPEGKIFRHSKKTKLILCVRLGRPCARVLQMLRAEVSSPFTVPSAFAPIEIRMGSVPNNGLIQELSIRSRNVLLN